MIQGIRWLIKRNSGITAAMVAERRAVTDEPMCVAKQALVNETKPVLQYCEEDGYWKDIPLVVLAHD